MLGIPALLARDLLLDGGNLLGPVSIALEQPLQPREASAAGRGGAEQTYQIGRLDLEGEFLLLQILHKQGTLAARRELASSRQGVAAAPHTGCGGGFELATHSESDLHDG